MGNLTLYHVPLGECFHGVNLVGAFHLDDRDFAESAAPDNPNEIEIGAADSQFNDPLKQGSKSEPTYKGSPYKATHFFVCVAL